MTLESPSNLVVLAGNQDPVKPDAAWKMVSARARTQNVEGSAFNGVQSLLH